jgi:hypothetical protein
MNSQNINRDDPKPYWRGAGAIIHYTDSFGKIFVLVGNETKYLSDYLPQVKELEYIFKISTFEQAMAEYGEIVRKLSLTPLFEDEPRRMLVTFDRPIWKGNHWRTHFRVKHRTPNHIMSVLKGGIERVDISPLDTAIREISDITGIKPHPSKLKPASIETGFRYFSHEITEDEAQKYNTSIATTQFMQIGKMHHLEFVELSQLLYDISKINRITTKLLINLFGKRFPNIVGQKQHHQNRA